MLKWIVILIGTIIGVMTTLIGMLMVLFGILSFFITWTRNPNLNTIGVYSFFIAIPIISLGIYVLRENWRYITGQESWYK
jgi:hypothetical protein